MLHMMLLLLNYDAVVATDVDVTDGGWKVVDADTHDAFVSAVFGVAAPTQCCSYS